MEKITFKPIGVIRSGFKQAPGTPIQAGTAKHIGAQIEIFDAYAEGLHDLDGFSHIILLYYFHLSSGHKLKVIPFMDSVERGVFATRAPGRPNSIGFAVVELISIEGNILHFKGTDMIDGTPVLDIKPYVPDFDHQNVVKTGWLEKKVKNLPDKTDDGRFLR
ncbi:MAG: tRNA (N6-threonylcarbamoyladenosine(37)-N6)-methyltransferase TrmO [Bacteroidales bacterium]|jgi:tRNA-Thr(GGU) m(6)t(6)A37 methyltransferase TsaA|nr:tRNA (N6-threonylcarbamoyladenosine(37)-N6)-methyltransferase TrmO [Bacteroidales bacterium]